jgi:hypothetical protein
LRLLLFTADLLNGLASAAHRFGGVKDGRVTRFYFLDSAVELISEFFLVACMRGDCGISALLISIARNY